MKNDNGTQLNILKQYLGERTSKCNEVLLRKGDILVMKWLNNWNEGKMKVTVPNEIFETNKAHQFDSFVQYIRIYTCIGNFQEYFDN